MPQLPYGDWIQLQNLPSETVAADIQAFFFNRTGLELPEEHIQVNERQAGKSTISALISLNIQQVREILEWAFHEDNISGNEVRFFIPQRRLPPHVKERY